MTKISVLIILATLFYPNTVKSQEATSIPRVPEWSKSAIWYQIFPERFANGDSNNDPKPDDMEGAWPYTTPDGWHVSPWTSDWYKLQPWEEKNGHNFYWNAGARRYGGDIQGIIDHLDYLHDLGVTAIYLNPIFDSPSSHKYDTRMYHHVDRNFGPDPIEDQNTISTENPADPATWKWTSADKLFLRLVREVHNRGMKIILDGVFNHVGTSFWAFQDVKKYRQKSLFKDWFKIKSWGDTVAGKVGFEYEGWNGVKDLPEINKDGADGLADGFAQHVHAVVRRWMDPSGTGNTSEGIDGWRLDVAEKVDIRFWRRFREWVKDINPHAYIGGEIWWKDWQKNEMFDATAWLQGDAFDGVMNYRFAQALKKFVVDSKNRITPKEFADSIRVLRDHYPEDNLLAMQNLVDSHDVDRIASQIVNPDKWYDHNANPVQNKDYDVRKPRAYELLKQKLIAGIQMTMPGSPMIYYGDEAGMWGGDDPDCRKPMVWADKTYEMESTDPLGRPRKPDSVSFNEDLFKWYKKLISLRKRYPELSVGRLSFVLMDNINHTIAYRRTLGNALSVVIANNGNGPQSLTIDLKFGDGGGNEVVNVIDGSRIIGMGNQFTINLAPYEIAVIRPEE